LIREHERAARVPTRQALAGYAILALALLLLGLSGLTHRFDLWLTDHELRWLRAWRVVEPAQEVALIGIDDATVQSVPEPIALWHRHLGELLAAVASLQPKAIGLDVVLPERSYDRIAPGYDRELVRGLARALSVCPVVVGVTVDAVRRPRRLLPEIGALVAPDGAGLILWPLDADHAVRRFDERLAQNGSAVPTFAGQIARRLGRDPGHGILDYSVGAPLDYVPMHAVLAALRSGAMDTLRPAFAGKIVLVGPLFEFEDRKPQPLNLARWESGQADAPGLLLHAQALRSVLGPGLIRELPAGWSFALALAVALIWFVPAAPWRALGLLGALPLVLLAAAVLLMDRGWHLAIALPLVAVPVAVLGRAGVQTVASFAERRRLRAALGGYVSPQVAQGVIDGRIAGGFEGRRYRLCVMFVDMRNYTPRSERTAPEDIIRLTNACFEEMVAAVHEQGGTVLQFMGDGMMAIFGAPNALDNPGRAALQATRAIFERIERLNATLTQRGVEPVRLGVGLNLGDAVVGHVGARSRYGYSAVGDVVNVASRIEGLSKEVGYPVVCSREVAEAAGPGYALVPLGDRAIKGHSPVSVYGWEPLPPAGGAVAVHDALGR
jgi:class 3 adenylate cyclase